MKILLINPPLLPEQRYGKDMAQFGPCAEPLGLAYIAATLEKGEHRVEIWDGQVQGYKLRLDGIDLVGISMLTPAYDVVKELCQRIKKYRPNMPIVVGGAHPTALPEKTLQEIPEIDAVVVGEGEKAMLDIADRGLEKGKTIYFYDPVDNLDDISMPARHLLPMDRYQITASRNQGNHAYTVSVARGCPFKCAFCSRINGQKVRFHSVDRVMEEVWVLITDYNAKEINFEADTITINRDFIFELGEQLRSSIERSVYRKVKWTCESRVDTVDKEMLEMMKASGCWQISYGVETGNQRLLDFIKKGTRLEQIRNTFDITKQVGINIRAFYMLGIPTETKKESIETIRFAKKLNADWSQFTLFTPFPGTELYKIVQKEENLSDNWADYKTHGGWQGGRLAYVPTGRTEEEMKDLQKRAYREVYIRPRVILAFIKRISSWAKFKEYMNGFILLLKTRFA